MLPRLFANGRTFLLAGLCGVGLLSAAVGIGIAYGVAELSAVVLGDHGSGDEADLWFALLPVAALLLFALQVLERVLSERLGQHYVVELRAAIQERLYALGDLERTRLRNGHLMTRFTADLTAIRSWVARGVATLFTGIAMLLGLLGYLVSREPVFGILVALLASLLIIVVALIGPALSKRIFEARRRRARLSAFMGERVTAMRGVRALRAGKADRKRLARLSRRLADAMVKREAWSESVRALPAVSGLTAPALCVVAAGMLPGAPLGAAELILVMTVAGMTARPLTQLSQAFVYRSNFRIARRMLATLFRLPVQPTRRSGGHGLRAGAAEIEVQSLRLRGKEEPVTVRVSAGARIVVAGPPASGKTRLLRQLAGFTCFYPRRVRISGRDMTTVARESLHREVRLLSPDMPLLKGSLSRNLGLRGTQRQALLPLLQQCGVVPDLLGEEQLDNFRVAEGGRNLSNSLRLRLLLARAIAGRPSVLLIDDFDQLQDFAVRRLIETLWRHKAGPAMLVVSGAESLHGTADDVWHLQDRESYSTGEAESRDMNEVSDDAA